VGKYTARYRAKNGGSFVGRTANLIAFATAILLAMEHASPASLNSCANVDVIGTFDDVGIHESDYGINVNGTFRIADEPDESRQPMFNLTSIDCEKQTDDAGKTSLECKLTKTSVYATDGKPNTDTPNCSLDLSTSSYVMKELQRGVLSGFESSTSCYNSTLTIDKNTKRVYLSFTRTKAADNYDRIRPGTCAAQPRTQVLMNCTAWARSRKGSSAPPRYCDFSNSSSK
jgi:hypothetical protein